MLSPFLRFPARGRCLHPAADAAALCAAAISGLKPATLASAEGLVGAMMSQSGAGASRREGQAEVAHAFAAGTASMPADEAEGLVCAILGVLAATNGVWSDEYRRGSHALYMALMGRRWAGSGAHEGALRGGLDDHTRLPAHAELVERLGIRHAADSHGGLEAKDAFLCSNHPSRGHALRCARPPSAVFTVPVSPAFMRGPGILCTSTNVRLERSAQALSPRPEAVGVFVT